MCFSLLTQTKMWTVGKVACDQRSGGGWVSFSKLYNGTSYEHNTTKGPSEMEMVTPNILHPLSLPPLAGIESSHMGHDFTATSGDGVVQAADRFLSNARTAFSLSSINRAWLAVPPSAEWMSMQPTDSRRRETELVTFSVGGPTEISAETLDFNSVSNTGD